MAALSARVLFAGWAFPSPSPVQSHRPCRLLLVIPMRTYVVSAIICPIVKMPARYYCRFTTEVIPFAQLQARFEELAKVALERVRLDLEEEMTRLAVLWAWPMKEQGGRGA